MRQRKKIRICFLCLCLIFLAGILPAGCGRKAEGTDLEAYDYYVYYLNQDRVEIVPLGYEPEAGQDDPKALASELMEQITSGTDQVEYQKVFPESVSLERYEFTGDLLQLYFNGAYSEMSPEEEVLCRGAIVTTLLQVDRINHIEFLVDGVPLRDAAGAEVGFMNRDTFLMDSGEDINDIQVADLTLYFASQDGKALVRETQHVYYYSSNISMEKLVMEQLLKGPKSENARNAITDGTELISVSVMDGVCFVNLNDRFQIQDYSIDEPVVIYSIVNSLTELPTVRKVQISVNGETNMVYRQDMSLQETYSMNRDLVREEGEEVEVDQQEEQKKEGIIDAGNLMDTGK